jgi:hypothetical protein
MKRKRQHDCLRRPRPKPVAQVPPAPDANVLRVAMAAEMAGWPRYESFVVASFFRMHGNVTPFGACQAFEHASKWRM